MIHRYTHNNVTWLDVHKPSSEEIRDIIDECNIPLQFATDLTTPTPKTEVSAQKGFLKITLDFPVVKRTDTLRPDEIKFLVTATHLITIRFEDIEAMHHFGKEYEVLCMLGSTSKKKSSAEILFVTMLNFLYESMYAKLDYLETKLQDAEEEIFNEHEKEMVFELSQISRRLIAFRQTISAHEQALSELPQAMMDAFSVKSGQRVHELEQHYKSLTRQIFALMSTLQDLRDTNNALVSTKQNEIMKIFTILAFITFPLTLFTSTFGMNTTTTPILGQENDFWIIIGVMVIVSISFFVFFKYKKWI